MELKNKFTLFLFLCLNFSQSLALIKLGLLLDFDDDVTKGLTNETIEDAIQSFRSDSDPVIEVGFITDLDVFAAEVEDSPSHCETLTAIISAVSCETTRQLYKVVTEHCPATLVLAVHDRLCERPSTQHGIGFPARTSYRDVFPMLIDMRHDFMRYWPKINLLHDDSVDKDSMQDLVNGLEREYVYGVDPPEVTVFHMKDQNNAISVSDHSSCMTKSGPEMSVSHLMEHLVHETDRKFFVVIGKSKTIEKAVEEAYNKSILIPPRRWLFVLTDSSVKKRRFWNNIGPILAATETALVRRTVSAYSRCGQLSEGCQFKLATDTLRASLEKIVGNWSQDRDLLSNNRKLLKNRILSDVRLRLHDSGTSFCGACDRFELQVFERKERKEHSKPWMKKKQQAKSVWVQDQDYDVHIHSTAEWTPVKGYMAKNQVFSAWARDENAAFQKETVIKAAVFDAKPRTNVVRNADGSCQVNGSAPAILQMLAERLNFTVVYNCEYTGYGRKVNGKWTDGVMKLLAEGKVDVLVNPIWKLPPGNEHLWQDTDFLWSRAFWENSAALMVQKSTEDHAWLFMLPFTWDVWYCLLGSLMVIAPLLYYVNGYCKYYDYNNMRKDKGYFSMVNCFWYVYGAAVGQGGDYLPPAVASRVLLASWWLFVIVVQTIYSGNLVACLTFPKIFQPIQNVDDLLHGWFIDWATQIWSPIEIVTKTEKFQPIHKLKDDMIYMDFNSNKEYIFDEVAADSMAWVGMQEEVRYHVSVDYLTGGVCRMHHAKDDVYRAPVYFAFRPGFDKGMISAINYEIHELGGAGFLVHWFKYYNQLGNDCLHPTLVYAGDVRRVELLHMYGCYVVLGVGLAVAIIAIVMELLFYKLIRPHLPEKFRIKNVNVLDYYNKVLVGYGYSNVAAMTPPKPKVQANSKSPVPGQGNKRNENNNNLNNSNDTEKSTSRESLDSANSRTGLYNTKQNYKNTYSNFMPRQKSDFKTKFGMT